MKKPTDSENYYKELFDLAADAILTGDPAGNIRGANQSATELSGYPLAELIGMNISCLFSAAEAKKVPFRYDLLKAGKVVQSKRLLTRRDGSSVPISMNSKKMPDDTYHSFLRNISRQTELEEKLRETNREMEAFIYTVSHDLRTPLSTIIGYTDFLREHRKEVLDEQTLEILTMIDQAGTDMLTSMEAMLVLATAGSLEYPDQPVDSNQVVTKTINDLKQQITAVGMTIRVSELPRLHVPEPFLSQLFGNLIGNALRYAGEESDCIEIGGERKENCIRMFVRDFGPGIPEQERDLVFDAFFRGSTKGNSTGTGVGLAIVQKIARTYGGKAWVEETPGGGCTFWVELKDLLAA